MPQKIRSASREFSPRCKLWTYAQNSTQRDTNIHGYNKGLDVLQS
jgi:hypothetical protein